MESQNGIGGITLLFL